MIVRKNWARKARIRQMNTPHISGINNSTQPPRSHNRRHSKRNRDHNLSGISNNTTSQHEGSSYDSPKLQKRKKTKSTVHEEDNQIEVILQRADDHIPAKGDMRHLNHSTSPYIGSRIVSPKSDGGKRSLKQSDEHHFRMVRTRSDDDNSISSDDAVVLNENHKTSKSEVGQTQKNTEKGKTSPIRDFFMRIKQTKHTSEDKHETPVSKPSGATFMNEGPSNVPSSNEAVRITMEEPILSFASDEHNSTDSNIELIFDDRNDRENTGSSFVSHQDENELVFHEDRNDSEVMDSSFVYNTTKPSIRYGNISTRQWSRPEAKYSQVSWNAPENSKTRDASMIKRPEVRRLDMKEKIILYLARPDLAPMYFKSLSPLLNKREEEKEATPSAHVQDNAMKAHDQKLATLDDHSVKKAKATVSSKDLKRPAEASCQMNPFCGLGKWGNAGDYSLANSNGSFEFAPQAYKGAALIHKKDGSVGQRLKSDTAAWI